MTGTVAPLLPDVSAPATAPFWEGARKHRLLMQRCAGCGLVRWPPKPVCPNCLRAGAVEDWQEVADTGAIWSFIVYHRAFHPWFADKVPYNVAYVKLDAGPMFISNVLGSGLEIGGRVKAHFDDVTPEVTLVRFEQLESARAR